MYFDYEKDLTLRDLLANIIQNNNFLDMHKTLNSIEMLIRLIKFPKHKTPRIYCSIILGSTESIQMNENNDIIKS